MDRMLLDGADQLGWRDPPRPVCEVGKGEAPLDAPVMRLVILLFGLTRLRPRVKEGSSREEGRPCNETWKTRDPPLGQGGGRLRAPNDNNEAGAP